MSASPAGRQREAALDRPCAESRQGELANLAYLAFDGAEAGKLMAEAARVVRERLGVEFSSVMELSAGEDELLLRAGEGWHDGAVGRERLAVGVGSDVGYVTMAAYALWDKNPVRVEDLAEDPRFGGCPLMASHGVVSGVMAKIWVGGRVFGTIGAHSRSRRVFGEEEAAWLGDLAKMLGGGLGHSTGHGSVRGSVRFPHQGAVGEEFLKDAMAQIVAAAAGGTLVLVPMDPARLFEEDSLERAEQFVGCAALVLAGRLPQGSPGAGLAGEAIDVEDHGRAAPATVHTQLRAPGDIEDARAVGLQPRQLDVLRLLDAGHSPKEIAAMLYCTEANVRKHLKRVYRALGVGGQVAALARARQLGLTSAR